MRKLQRDLRLARPTKPQNTHVPAVSVYQEPLPQLGQLFLSSNKASIPLKGQVIGWYGYALVY
jgi:hypothetical protein